jgi:hypothetical protein
MDLITFKNILKFEMSSFLEKNTQIKAFKIIINKKFKNFLSSNININNRYISVVNYIKTLKLTPYLRHNKDNSINIIQNIEIKINRRKSSTIKKRVNSVITLQPLSVSIRLSKSVMNLITDDSLASLINYRNNIVL